MLVFPILHASSSSTSENWRKKTSLDFHEYEKWGKNNNNNDQPLSNISKLHEDERRWQSNLSGSIA